MPSLKDILFGSKQKTEQKTLQTPEMQELLKMIIEGVKGGESPFKDLFGGFNQAEFDKGVTEPALKNFQEQILPMLQHKFIGSGTTQGSAFQKAQLKAGGDLQAQLAQLLYQAQQGQKQNQIAGINTALGQRPFENVIQGATTGALPGALQGLIQGGAKAAGTAIAG